MRAFLLIVSLFLAAASAPSQARAAEESDAQAKDGVRKLYSDYSEAASKRDREALERLLTEGYVWVRGNGSVTPKAKHIENILGNTSQFSMPTLPLDQLTVHREMAILRATEVRDGLFATTVFAKRDGRWQFVHSQGTLLPPERKAVELDPRALDAFVGSYVRPQRGGDGHEGRRRPNVERRKAAAGQARAAL